MKKDRPRRFARGASPSRPRRERSSQTIPNRRIHPRTVSFIRESNGCPRTRLQATVHARARSTFPVEGYLSLSPSFFFFHSKRNPRVSSARFVITRDLFSRRTECTCELYRYESIECIYNIYIYFFYTHVYIRIHNTYVPTYVRPTKGRQAQSRVGSNPIDRPRFLGFCPS